MKSQNLTITPSKDGKSIAIKVDVNGNTSPSKSGKTLVIASTRGNVDVGDGVFVGLNVYRYAEPREDA